MGSSYSMNNSNNIAIIKNAIVLTDQNEIKFEPYEILYNIQHFNLSIDDIADIILFCVDKQHGGDIITGLLKKYPKLDNYMSKITNEHIFLSIWKIFLEKEHMPNVKGNVLKIISEVKWYDQNFNRIYESKYDLHKLYFDFIQ